MTIDEIKNRYKSRIDEIFKRLAEAFGKQGFVSDKYELLDFTDDEFSWGMGFDDGRNGLDVRFTIIEQDVRDGDENSHGISFDLRVHDDQSRLLVGITPYNYTERCWVDMSDEDAVEQRFLIVENFDEDDFVQEAIEMLMSFNKELK